MLTLGIETSCDETSVAVLEGLHKVRANIVSSSLLRHKKFGGIVPEIASRHSLEQMKLVFQESLKKARLKPKQLSLIAVTNRPGLIGSLLVGVSFAKALGYGLNIPVAGINHLEAHLAINFIGKKIPKKYIGLIVSGGHTLLVLVKRGKFYKIGGTVDDAIGEAYDKVAKMLGFEFPGGPILDKLAQKGNKDAFRFTEPKQEGLFDFSFSGIKTAVLLEIQKNKTRSGNKQFQNDLSASFQYSVMNWLVKKTIKAADYFKTSHVVLGGGVSANSLLRKLFQNEKNIEVFFPPIQWTSDNGLMIARRGAELFQSKKLFTPVSASPHALSEWKSAF